MAMTKIYYFSATGNSLAIARKIAAELGDTEIISIPRVLHSKVDFNASRIGFIFPVNMWGLPHIMVEFLSSFRPNEKQYLFAVATCGGSPGRTLKQLNSILHKSGAELNAGFVCREGSNTVAEAPGLIRFMNRISGKTYPSGSERLPEIIKVIKSGKENKPETSLLAANLLGSAFYNLGWIAANGLKASDRSFSVDNKCKSCGTCERICPRANIKIENGKPVWKHNCELCNACIQWCPSQAIHKQGETCRYRNPEMKAEDFILR